MVILYWRCHKWHLLGHLSLKFVLCDVFARRHFASRAAEECEYNADIFLLALQPRVGVLSSGREIYVWFFVFCFLWQRNSHLNCSALFKPPPSLWVSSSQSLQCPDVIQCMHKPCYCLTESRGWGLRYLVAATYLCLSVSRKGHWPVLISWI